MKLKNIILTIVLAIFYPFSLLQKNNANEITFISLESKSLARDFETINAELVKRGQYQLTYHLFEYAPDIKIKWPMLSRASSNYSQLIGRI